LRYALSRYSIFGVGRYAPLSAIDYYGFNSQSIKQENHVRGEST